MRFKLSKRKEFSGRVLDGPFEGDWIEEDSPYFEGTYTRATPVQQYSAMLANVAVEIDRVFYKWLPSYRAWAWVQPEKRMKW
jgi:hypothetical protein